ncbi:hypothetical protein NEOKW01_1618 [Nematocida sp. AWRm80]|nr:hypothetical protein NEOKW01_1618 [Nematocida sp. AWRm80]
MLLSNASNQSIAGSVLPDPNTSTTEIYFAKSTLVVKRPDNISLNAESTIRSHSDVYVKKPLTTLNTIKVCHSRSENETSPYSSSTSNDSTSNENVSQNESVIDMNENDEQMIKVKKPLFTIKRIQLAIETVLVSICILAIWSVVQDQINTSSMLGMLPYLLIMGTILFSLLFWRLAIDNSSLSRRKQHRAMHKNVCYILISLGGAYIISPWMLFILCIRPSTPKLFLVLCGSFLLILLCSMCISSQNMRDIISIYPVLCALIVNAEEIISSKGQACKYERSLQYILVLTIVFLTISIVFSVFSICNTKPLSMPFLLAGHG